MSMPVVRVSILRCDASLFQTMRQMMAEAEDALRPGIEAMPGLLAYYAGSDDATHSLTNTSVWDTLEHARQLDYFQPMLESGKRFAAAGATFERPIMNYATLWRFGCHSGTQQAAGKERPRLCPDPLGPEAPDPHFLKVRDF